MTKRTATIAARLVLYRWKIIDASAVLLVGILTAFYAYEVDIYRDPAQTAVGQKIELDEMMVIASVLCLGMMLFALRRLAEARQEAARRIEAERTARTLALHDVLTGLPNRRQFEEALQVAIASPPRAGASHALLMLDLNGFKRINDVFGHQVGDEVLIHVGGRLNRALRDGDMVVRLGGDEFAILATQVSGAEAATGLARRVMEALQAPIETAAGQHTVGVAIGIVLTPQDAGSAEELVRKGDISLYRAKEEKTRSLSAFRFFEAEMDAHVRERDVLERELRDAIADQAIRRPAR